MEAEKVLDSKLVKRIQKIYVAIAEKIRVEKININLEQLVFVYEKFVESEDFLFINDNSYDSQKHSKEDILKLAELEDDDNVEEWIGKKLYEKYSPTFWMCPIINLGDMYVPVVARDSTTKAEVKLDHNPNGLVFLLFQTNDKKVNNVDLENISNRAAKMGVDFKLYCVEILDNCEPQANEEYKKLGINESFLDFCTPDGKFLRKFTI